MAMKATCPNETSPVLPANAWKPTTMTALMPNSRTISVIVVVRGRRAPAIAVTIPTASSGPTIAAGEAARAGHVIAPQRQADHRAGSAVVPLSPRGRRIRIAITAANTIAGW